MSDLHSIQTRNRSNAIGMGGGPQSQTLSRSGTFGQHSVSRGEAPPSRAPGFSFGQIGEALKSIFSRRTAPSSGETTPVPVAQRQVDQVAHKMAGSIHRVEDLKTRNPELYAQFKANLEMIGVAYEALSLAPGTPSEMREHIETMAEMSENLGTLSRELQDTIGKGGKLGELATVMGQVAEATKSDIENRIAYLTDVPPPPGPVMRQVEELARQVGGLINDVEHLKSVEQMKETPSPVGSNTLKNCLQEIGNALEELRETPSGHTAMSGQIDKLLDVAERLKAASGQLDELRKAGGEAGDIATRMQALVDKTTTSLSARTDALVKASGLIPLSEETLFNSKTFSTKGAIKLIQAEIDKIDAGVGKTGKGTGKAGEMLGPELTKQREVLQNAKEYLENRVEQMKGKTSTEQLSKDEAAKIMGSKGPDKGIGILGAPSSLKKSLDERDYSQPLPKDLMPLSHPDIREEGMLELFLGHVFKDAGLTPPKDMRGAMLEGRLAALNEHQWKPIHKDVVMQKDGINMTFHSEINPQSQLGRTFDDMNGGGVVCHMAQSYKHVTTLAQTNLTAPDGTKLFEGIRHGAISPYDISVSKLGKMDRGKLEAMVTDLLPYGRWQAGESGFPDLRKTVDLMMSDKNYMSECANIMRQRGADRRAVDVTTSALVKNPDKFQRALSGEVVEINLNSIGLLTADPRSGKTKPKAGNEGLMISDQREAWSRLSGPPQPKTITVKDSNGNDVQVKVKVSVNSFNFGVNGMTFGARVGGVQIAPSSLTAGWAHVEEQNRKAMAGLIGSPEDRATGGYGGQIGEWLKNAPRGTPEERQKVAHVETLARQIGEIYDSESYKTPGKEPYKLGSRIAVLTSMIGEDVCWNCKSGKDRTGELDVEAKNLAMQIWMTGRVPEPDEPKSPQDKQNQFRLATEGGNFELQRYNTAAPGFKLGGVPALEAQYTFGEKSKHFKFFQGAAGFYGS